LVCVVLADDALSSGRVIGLAIPRATIAERFEVRRPTGLPSPRAEELFAGTVDEGYAGSARTIGTQLDRKTSHSVLSVKLVSIDWYGRIVVCGLALE